MQVNAHLRQLRMSPRKVRLVADVVRGLDVAQADAQLAFLPKAAARPVRKLVASAVANATHNFGLNPANLYVVQVRVDQGPTLKRFRARAFGRAATIRKRSSHVAVVLGERVPTAAADIRKPKNAAHVVPAPTMVADRATALREGSSAEHDAADAGNAAAASRRGDVGGKGATGSRKGFLRTFMNRRTGTK